MNFIKKYFSHLIFISFMIFFVSVSESTDEIDSKLKNEIEQDKDYSIAKVKYKGKYYIKYIYYYDNKKHTGSSDKGDETLIDRFFIVELSKKKPELSIIRIDKEVKDSTKIANSGFREKTLDEILEMK
jgi:hypothetical protein